MRGHEPLIALRRRGLKPGMVFVDIDVPALTSSGDQWQRNGMRPCVEIPAGENLERLDLRWAKGIGVWASGPDGDRVRRMLALLVEAGADRVVASCMQRIGDDEFTAFRCTWTLDTAGHMGEKPAEVSHGAHAVA